MPKIVSGYYWGKGIFTALQTIIFIACIYWIELSLIDKFLMIGCGVIVGFVLSKIRWSLSKKVDYGLNFTIFLALGETGVILPLVAILLIIIYYFIPSPWFHYIISPYFGIAVLSTWMSYLYLMFYNIYSYEKQFGVLPIIELFPPKVNGIESMINKTATVHSQCNPIGTIKYKSVIWNAEAVDGIELLKGEQVIIIDVKGLKTFIEKLAN